MPMVQRTAKLIQNLEMELELVDPSNVADYLNNSQNYIEDIKISYEIDPEVMRAVETVQANISAVSATMRQYGMHNERGHSEVETMRQSALLAIKALAKHLEHTKLNERGNALGV
ncbi:hypothetical protein MKK70_05820 [Methylobacterium sp. E-041]|uniref:hypothetical protein n=1 Tax=Methylobacterium sp. E-041 TaxID=2836573 RepID=UPI001FBA47AC|nr:hypothetical protein [Methylobacterium sp. E-041]MCJ2104904.1 hypothetical protein [Methylobacterium sp. E-041]